MKSYFEKHFKQKVLTQPGQAQQLSSKQVPNQSGHSAQFSWVKPNKASSFFKSKHAAKMISHRKIGEIQNKLDQAVKNKPRVHINKSNQLQKLESLRESEQQVSSQFMRERGFSLEYLKMTKRHKVKSLLQKNALKHPLSTQSKAWLDSPFDKIQLPFSQNMKPKAYQSTRKVLTPLNGEKFNDNGSLGQQGQQNHSNSSDHLTLIKNKTKKQNNFFKKYATDEQALASNQLRSPSSQQRTTPISFIPIESIRLESTRYGGFSQPKTYNTERQANNKTFAKKSKYSPFKSRNGSSASNQGISLVKINSKDFSVQDEKGVRSTAGFKQPKHFQVNKHKRLKSNIQYLKNLVQKSQQSIQRQASQTFALINNKHTAEVLVQGLFGNLKLLNDIKECFDLEASALKQQKSRLTKLSELIKIYVFGEKDVAEKKYINHLFPHMDQLFEKNQEKCLIKQIICAERLLMICIVDLISQEKVLALFEEVKLTLMILLIIYLKIFKFAESSKIGIPFTSEQERQLSALQKNKKLKSKQIIQTHLKVQLLPYVDNLFRHSRELYENLMKQEIQDSKARTINRSFYEILKKYAIYLTRNEQTTLKKYNNPLICNFATCPAPYILSKPEKRYTLCIDLDETLLYSNFSCTKRFDTSYRPGAKEFIIQLSKYYEIIVFTSSVKQYADAVIKPFVQFVDHVLYRYHVTRGINLSSTVKDLSRIGRRLQKVIFIDDLQCNTKLQPQNSIRVTGWKGDPKDKEIITLKKHLIQLGKEQKQHEDLRKVIGEIRQKLKSEKRSPSKSPELK